MSNTYTRIMAAAAATALTFTAAAASALDISSSLGHPGFNRAQTSLSVVDAASGKELTGFQPDLKLNPASCSKILTSSTALAILGPDHRFLTHFYADRHPERGTIGTLYVAGQGDPMLVNEEITQLARHLAEKGIKRITDGIVVDNSYFDSYEYPRKQTGEGRAYTAKTAATAVNFNSLAVLVGPGAKNGAPADVQIDPPTNFYKIINKAVTGGKFRVAMALGSENGRPTVTVTGRVPLKFEPQKLYRSVSDPASLAGAVIGSWLREAGVEVGPAVREGRVPGNAVGIMTWESRPLYDIMSSMNKASNNFIAEQTLKHLGAAKMGAPGSTAKGVAVIEGYLASIGIPKGSYVVENGSGLSEETRISGRQLAEVLAAAYRNQSIRQPFIDSLSVLGVDGTTKRWRFAPDLAGRIQVKTGTLDGVSTLSGFAPLPDGRIAAFAILANGLPRGAWTAHEAEIEVVRAITGVSR